MSQDSRQLVLHAGNSQATARRLGLAVLAAKGLMRQYRIDPQRVYAAGWSGGARMAGLLGFFQPDVFSGTIQSCGADFYQHVPQNLANSQTDTNGYSDGFFEAETWEIDHARRVRFALVTGSNDFRRGNVLDLFYGGFHKLEFQAKLFDVPGIGHEPADARSFAAALDYIDPVGGFSDR